MALLLGIVAMLPAIATPPFALPDQVTDQVGAVEGHSAEIQAAFDELEAEHGVRMWVVFVDTFDGVDPQQWADRTFAATYLGVDDYLLAVAMTDRQYGYVVDRAFVLDDDALARVAAAAERHLAENPPRAVTEAALTISDEVLGAASSVPATDGSGSGWGVLGVALAVVVGVCVVGGLLLYMSLRGGREGPGPGYGPQDTSSGSSPWWGGSSDSWSSSVSSDGGWSGGSDNSGGGGDDTRGGSGSF